MNNDDLVLANTMIDLGDVGAVETLKYSSYGTDTISISGLDYTSMANNTITLPSSAYSVGTASPYAFNTSAGYNGTTWSTGTANTVRIDTDGIDMVAGADITIDGKSLKEFMNKMEQRLAILVPDPAKLEKFQALKRAYEHYKTMESLCFDEPEESK